MPRELASTDLPHLVEPGHHVFVAGGTAEPAAILSTWREAGLPAGVTLIGCQLPGLNRFAPDEFAPDCRFRTSFLSPGLRDAFHHGRVDVLPMHHADFYKWLATDAPIDLAVVQVAPPDANGNCNLGPCADMLPAIASRTDRRIVAQLNPLIPPCRNGLSLPIERFEAVVNGVSDLPELPTTPGSDSDAAIAENVASLLGDGETVQIGIGRLPDLVLRHLGTRRRIRLHGGTVSQAALELLESGVAESVVTGYAGGDMRFYQRAALSEIQFRPVSFTHGPERLRDIPKFAALNGALEVDLLGQANCEAVSGRLMSSFGGINDFMRAAHRSPGGTALVMLPAQSRDGRVSRVVTRIGDPGLVSVQRGDVDVVVTEYGIADLRGSDLDQRAARLIAVAAPDWRARLAAGWRDLRASL